MVITWRLSLQCYSTNTCCNSTTYSRLGSTQVICTEKQLPPSKTWQKSKVTCLAHFTASHVAPYTSTEHLHLCMKSSGCLARAVWKNPDFLRRPGFHFLLKTLENIPFKANPDFSSLVKCWPGIYQDGPKTPKAVAHYCKSEMVNWWSQAKREIRKQRQKLQLPARQLNSGMRVREPRYFTILPLCSIHEQPFKK